MKIQIVRIITLAVLAMASAVSVAEYSSGQIAEFRKLAEQGNPHAQALLGSAYIQGDGVPQDKREAVRWWRKAAEQGNARAQVSLGRAYFFGEGIIIDYREAYIWYSIVKANGNENADDIISGQSVLQRPVFTAEDYATLHFFFGQPSSVYGGKEPEFPPTPTFDLRKHNWRNYLSRAEIRSAQKEAARRMEAIENRTKKPAVSANIAITPKKTNIAERVFENTWRSVVVVVSGDGQGSGVIIRPNIVATNCHVVDVGSSIAVYKSVDRRADTDSTFAATIRRSDEGKDFCLLDVYGLWGVPAAVRRYDTLKVGEDVYGLGAPKGLDLSFSDGLISQLREVDGSRFIQTNTAISPGSSGGGLFDSEGNLVGIMTSKISDENAEGLGFAIPADLVLE